VHLSVLLDNAETPLKIGRFAMTHGQTLKSLVWESRRGPETTIEAKSSHPLNDYIDEDGEDIRELELIHTCCTQLEQIGIAIDWNSGLDSRGEVQTIILQPRPF